MFKDEVVARFNNEFGVPARSTVKVVAWNVAEGLGVVTQIDQPNRDDYAFVWLPYPPDSESLPEIALEYAGETGRHSNTYPSPGLERGKPALKLVVTSKAELDDLVAYIEAFKKFQPLPQVKSAPEPRPEDPDDDGGAISVDVASMPAAPKPKPRRKAIPRAVQREVWQRDSGRCVECESKERLCFDHIVPFSKGGSNTVRNLQLLCERCNLSKGNRI